MNKMLLGAPDVSESVLSDADHAHFLEHGYVVVKEAVPPEIISEALAVLESEAPAGHVGGADYRPLRGEAIQACMTDTVLDAIGELFGPDYPFTRTRQGADMPRPQEPEREWPAPRAHIDDDYPTFMPAGWAVGVFVFLTTVQPQGGAFVVFPGSPRRYQEQMAATPGAFEQAAADAALAGAPEEYLAEAGDALLFHHLMGHSGSPNVSDPRTRHALLSRWHPQRRIVPGSGEVLSTLSTIEKANSAAALREFPGRPAAALACDTGTEASARLHAGILPPGASSAGICCHSLLHFAGRTSLFWVDAVRPTLIQQAVSTDLLRWETGDSLPEQASPVTSLSVFQRGRDAQLAVGTAQGTLLLVSPDLSVWETALDVPGETAGSTFACSVFGSRTARGKILLSSKNGLGQPCARWAKEWAEIGTAEAASITPPAGDSRIRALFVRPVLGEERFALIADLQTGEEPTRPFYALSDDCVSYSASLQPLACTAPTPPRAA